MRWRFSKESEVTKRKSRKSVGIAPPCRPRRDKLGRHPLAGLFDATGAPCTIADGARAMNVAYPTALEWVRQARRNKRFRLPAERVVLLVGGLNLPPAMAYALRPDLWNRDGLIAAPGGGK
jgi:hypothetical protein